VCSFGRSATFRTDKLWARYGGGARWNGRTRDAGQCPGGAIGNSLGLWIFGWKKLSPRVYLTTLWLAVIGSLLSAFFIIVANSRMQHPVGITYSHGRPVLKNVWAVLINNTAINAYEHTLTGSPAVRAAFVLGISWYQLWRRREDAIDTVGPDRLVIVGSSVSLAGRWW